MHREISIYSTEDRDKLIAAARADMVNGFIQRVNQKIADNIKAGVNPDSFVLVLRSAEWAAKDELFRIASQAGFDVRIQALSETVHFTRRVQ